MTSVSGKKLPSMQMEEKADISRARRPISKSSMNVRQMVLSGVTGQ